MSKGTGAVIELGAISALFVGAVACTLSSLSKQPYDLVEIRFCPPSANGLRSNDQQSLDERYCSVPRFVLKEEWDMRGLFGSRIPEREDVKFKRLLPSDNPYQHIALTGTALCLAGIGAAIATRNNLLQNKYYNWLEELKTAGFTTWTQQKSGRELIAFNQQLNTQLKADVAAALDNQTRVQAGLTNVESLEKQQQKQETLATTQYELMLAELHKKIAEEHLAQAKAKHEQSKLVKGTNTTEKTNPKQEVIERLQNHENGWLYEICTGIKPLYIIGDQGSFKSYSAAAIALVRQYLEGCKLEAIIDPHFHQNKSKSWKTLLNLQPKTYGANQNWYQINQGIQDALSRWDERTLDDKPICSIFDEMTNYSLHEECLELSAELNRRILSDPRKSNEGVIIISHGFTNAATGGTSGFAKTRESGTLQLELRSDNKMRPLFKGTLNGYKDADGNLIKDLPISLPDWFKPETIYNWLWNHKSPPTQSAGPSQEQLATEREDWHEEMEKWVKQQEKPTPIEVKQKWESLTGLTLNDRGLKDLMQYLGL
ncbi:hypothetical protein [Scytonema millei]|uniref:Uncharacterized protein n=1 Tax=Tolypothrix bouteillei VB521301 TaxID=1479485 RepID=A0A0C1R262_9CYAN